MYGYVGSLTRPVTILLRNRKYVGKWRNPWREAPSAPPLGELLSEREAEGVRYEI